MIKLDKDCLKHIDLFQKITKAQVKDCIINHEKVLFVVNPGQAGVAIGKNGVNIKRIQGLIKKNVEVIEFNNDLLSCLNNLFRPTRIKEFVKANRGDKEVIRLTIDSPSVNNHQVNYKTFVRSKAKKARLLLKKYFNIDDINFV